jgi:hypothetical protein
MSTPIEEAALALYAADDAYESAIRIPGAPVLLKAWDRVAIATTRQIDAECAIVEAIRKARPRC